VKILAIIYSALFGCIAIWAWSSHLLYGASVKEHLLPDVMLSFVTMPLSLLLAPFAEKFGELISDRWAALIILTVFGAAQTILLWLVVRTLRPVTPA
jgi:hypothetical protein